MSEPNSKEIRVRLPVELYQQALVESCLEYNRQNVGAVVVKALEFYYQSKKAKKTNR